MIRSLPGESAEVDPEWVASLEISEGEALRWAKEELGESLDELKQGIDEKLADWRRRLDEFNRRPITQKSTVTPEAASVFFDFLKQLPGIFRESVSGDQELVDSARKATADLASRFKEAGLEADDRLESFPERLVKIRENTDS
ncbi:MAG: hypothetical protein AABN95_03465 [Acidobacteriota bacterium]